MSATVVIDTYADAVDAYHRPELRQAQYEEGTVMRDVLVNLHGRPHRDRRRVENRLFRRDVFRYYESEAFPEVLARRLAPCRDAGRGELVEFGHHCMLEIAALIAGVDRSGDPAEDARLAEHLGLFIEALTFAQSTADPDERQAAIGQGLRDWDKEFFQPAAERRRALLRAPAAATAGDIGADRVAAPPRDLLTTLLRDQETLGLADDAVLRETAFFFLVAAHTSATAFVRSVHHILTWTADRPDRAARVHSDPLLVQRCVHETVRLNSSSPVGMRRAAEPVRLRSGVEIPVGAKVIIDLHKVNTDAVVYGQDAAVFDPDRTPPAGALPYGLSFAAGPHTCIGQDLAVGVVPRERDGDRPANRPANHPGNHPGNHPDDHPDDHLYGLVTVAVRALLGAGVRPDPDRPPESDPTTERRYWSRYPVRISA